MKKILLAVTAALAITGCSQNEEFESTGLKSEIVFNTIAEFNLQMQQNSD